jgi:hypothetical protein
MTQDDQFEALGPTSIGFLTSSTDIDVGADIHGNSTGGKFNCEA